MYHLIEYKGQGVCDGIAKGKILIYKALDKTPRKNTIANAEEEIERLDKAKQISLAELQQIYEKAKRILSKNNADIFKSHVMILKSPDYIDKVAHMIRKEMVSSEYAVFTISNQYKNSLEKSGMSSSISDIDDVSQCLLRNLQNEGFNNIVTKEKVILCADDILPSQVLDINKANITGICLIGEKHWGHVKLVAQEMNTPAVVGINGITDRYNGKDAELNGKTGILKVY